MRRDGVPGALSLGSRQAFPSLCHGSYEDFDPARAHEDNALALPRTRRMNTKAGVSLSPCRARGCDRDTPPGLTSRLRHVRRTAPDSRPRTPALSRSSSMAASPAARNSGVPHRPPSLALPIAPAPAPRRIRTVSAQRQTENNGPPCHTPERSMPPNPFLLSCATRLDSEAGRLKPWYGLHGMVDCAAVVRVRWMGRHPYARARAALRQQSPLSHAPDSLAASRRSDSPSQRMCATADAHLHHVHDDAYATEGHAKKGGQVCRHTEVARVTVDRPHETEARVETAQVVATSEGDTHPGDGRAQHEDAEETVKTDEEETMRSDVCSASSCAASATLSVSTVSCVAKGEAHDPPVVKPPLRQGKRRVTRVSTSKKSLHSTHPFHYRHTALTSVVDGGSRKKKKRRAAGEAGAERMVKVCVSESCGRHTSPTPHSASDADDTSHAMNGNEKEKVGDACSSSSSTVKEPFDTTQSMLWLALSPPPSMPDTVHVKVHALHGLNELVHTLVRRVERTCTRAEASPRRGHARWPRRAQTPSCAAAGTRVTAMLQLCGFGATLPSEHRIERTGHGKEAAVMPVPSTVAPCACQPEQGNSEECYYNISPCVCSMWASQMTGESSTHSKTTVSSSSSLCGSRGQWYGDPVVLGWSAGVLDVCDAVSGKACVSATPAHDGAVTALRRWPPFPCGFVSAGEDGRLALWQLCDTAERGGGDDVCPARVHRRRSTNNNNNSASGAVLHCVSEWNAGGAEAAAITALTVWHDAYDNDRDELHHSPAQARRRDTTRRRPGSEFRAVSYAVTADAHGMVRVWRFVASSSYISAEYDSSHKKGEVMVQCMWSQCASTHFSPRDELQPLAPVVVVTAIPPRWLISLSPPRLADSAAVLRVWDWQAAGEAHLKVSRETVWELPACLRAPNSMHYHRATQRLMLGDAGGALLAMSLRLTGGRCEVRKMYWLVVPPDTTEKEAHTHHASRPWMHAHTLAHVHSGEISFDSCSPHTVVSAPGTTPRSHGINGTQVRKSGGDGVLLSARAAGRRDTARMTTSPMTNIHIPLVVDDDGGDGVCMRRLVWSVSVSDAPAASDRRVSLRVSMLTCGGAGHAGNRGFAKDCACVTHEEQRQDDEEGKPGDAVVMHADMHDMERVLTRLHQLQQQWMSTAAAAAHLREGGREKRIAVAGLGVNPLRAWGRSDAAAVVALSRAQSRQCGQCAFDRWRRWGQRRRLQRRAAGRALWVNRGEHFLWQRRCRAAWHTWMCWALRRAYSRESSNVPQPRSEEALASTGEFHAREFTKADRHEVCLPCVPHRTTAAAAAPPPVCLALATHRAAQALSHRRESLCRARLFAGWYMLVRRRAAHTRSCLAFNRLLLRYSEWAYRDASLCWRALRSHAPRHRHRLNDTNGDDDDNSRCAMRHLSWAAESEAACRRRYFAHWRLLLPASYGAGGRAAMCTRTQTCVQGDAHGSLRKGHDESDWALVSLLSTTWVRADWLRRVYMTRWWHWAVHVRPAKRRDEELCTLQRDVRVMQAALSENDDEDAKEEGECIPSIGTWQQQPPSWLPSSADSATLISGEPNRSTLVSLTRRPEVEEDVWAAREAERVALTRAREAWDRRARVWRTARARLRACAHFHTLLGRFGGAGRRWDEWADHRCAPLCPLHGATTARGWLMHAARLHLDGKSGPMDRIEDGDEDDKDDAEEWLRVCPLVVSESADEAELTARLVTVLRGWQGLVLHMDRDAPAIRAAYAWTLKIRTPRGAAEKSRLPQPRQGRGSTLPPLRIGDACRAGLDHSAMSVTRATSMRTRSVQTSVCASSGQTASAMALFFDSVVQRIQTQLTAAAAEAGMSASEWCTALEEWSARRRAEGRRGETHAPRAATRPCVSTLSGVSATMRRELMSAVTRLLTLWGRVEAERAYAIGGGRRGASGVRRCSHKGCGPAGEAALTDASADVRVNVDASNALLSYTFPVSPSSSISSSSSLLSFSSPTTATNMQQCEHVKDAIPHPPHAFTRAMLCSRMSALFLIRHATLLTALLRPPLCVGNDRGWNRCRAEMLASGQGDAETTTDETGGWGGRDTRTAAEVAAWRYTGPPPPRRRVSCDDATASSSSSAPVSTALWQPALPPSWHHGGGPTASMRVVTPPECAEEWPGRARDEQSCTHNGDSIHYIQQVPDGNRRRATSRVTRGRQTWAAQGDAAVPAPCVGHLRPPSLPSAADSSMQEEEEEERGSGEPVGRKGGGISPSRHDTWVAVVTAANEDEEEVEDNDEKEKENRMQGHAATTAVPPLLSTSLSMLSPAGSPYALATPQRMNPRRLDPTQGKTACGGSRTQGHMSRSRDDSLLDEDEDVGEGNGWNGAVGREESCSGPVTFSAPSLSLVSTPRSMTCRSVTSGVPVNRPYLGFRVYVHRTDAGGVVLTGRRVVPHTHAGGVGGVIVIKEVAEYYTSASAGQLVGPARAAGLRAGDELVRFAGYTVTDLAAFNAIVSRHVRPGVRLGVTVRRAAEELSMVIHVGTRVC